MINLYNPDLVVTIGVVLLVYLITIPIVGAVKAFVANRLGDDSPEVHEYLTLNPVVHCNPFWIIILTISQVVYSYMPFGAATQVKVDEHNFMGKRRKLKYLVSLFSDTFAAYLLGMISFTSLLLMNGVQVIPLLLQKHTMKTLSSVLPAQTSFLLIVTFLLITAFIMTTFTAALTFLLNIFRIIQIRYGYIWTHASFAVQIAIMFGFIAILCLCIDPIYKLFTYGIGVSTAMVLYASGLLY